MSSLRLRRMRVDDEPVMRAMHARLAEEGFELLLDEGSWGEILDVIEREAVGIDLPPDRVRADYLVAEVHGELVGRTSIRYALTPRLLDVGGHVGYAVDPAHRRRGHASEILRQSIARLAAAGVDRVLVTCDDDNVASAAVIERCGGSLEDVRAHGEGPGKRRYWIEARQVS